MGDSCLSALRHGAKSDSIIISEPLARKSASGRETPIAHLLTDSPRDAIPSRRQKTVSHHVQRRSRKAAALMDLSLRSSLDMHLFIKVHTPQARGASRESAR